MIQRNAETLGKYGCYFLSILHLAEMLTGRTIDPARAYDDCVRFRLILPDCYVNNAGDILSFYTDQKWKHYHEDLGYKINSGEMEIVRYEWAQTMKTTSHFVVGDQSGRVGWDPYGDSETVRNGKPVSRRIFRRVA